MILTQRYVVVKFFAKHICISKNLALKLYQKSFKELLEIKNILII